MQIQWYPGHMTKALRAFKEDLKLIDLCIELLDTRAVSSSRNPDIDRLCEGKFRLVILNKADLAEEETTKLWCRYFEEQGIAALAMDSRNTKISEKVTQAALSVCKEKIERDRKRGILNRPIRAVVAGIPNVGKSTFINSLAGRAAAKTGNKPGVTKGNQWIRLNRQIELLDTPGILWPKFDDETVGTHLAFIGSVNDTIIDKEALALEFLDWMKEHRPELLSGRYEGLELSENGTELLEKIAFIKKSLKKGGEADTERAASLVLDDFRSGKFGRISLERPYGREE